MMAAREPPLSGLRLRQRLLREHHGARVYRWVQPRDPFEGCLHQLDRADGPSPDRLHRRHRVELGETSRRRSRTGVRARAIADFAVIADQFDGSPPR